MMSEAALRFLCKYLLILSRSWRIINTPELDEGENQMHFIFILLHLAAFLFFMPALFLTIIGHVICSILASKKG